MHQGRAFLLAVLVAPLAAQAQKPVKPSKPVPQAEVGVPVKVPVYDMERTEGPSMKTDLGYSIFLNRGTSLNREWFTLRDPAAPAQLEGPTGITVAYQSDRANSHYVYRVKFTVKPSEPITAVEVRVLVFDIFGHTLRTLSATEVDDSAGPKTYSSEWRIWSEHDASEAFTSVAYVAQVRTASGRVYAADSGSILNQVRKVARKITEEDLEPKREGPKK